MRPVSRPLHIEIFRCSEVAQSQVVVPAHQQVLRLQVPVDDSFSEHQLQDPDKLRSVELDQRQRHAAIEAVDQREEVPVGTEFQDEVKVVHVLEGVKEPHGPRVVF